MTIKSIILQKLNEGMPPSPDVRSNFHHFTTNEQIAANYAGRTSGYRKQPAFVEGGSVHMGRIKQISGLDIHDAGSRAEAYDKAYAEKNLFGQPKWHGVLVNNTQDLPINPDHSPHNDTTSSWGGVGVLFTDRLPKEHYLPGVLKPPKNHAVIWHGTSVDNNEPRTRLK